MQCGELMYRRAPIMTQGSDSSDKMPKKSVIKETIHSGHFMVSDFEAEAQDDEDLVAVPVPDEESRPSIITPTHQNIVACVDGDRTLKSKGPQKVSLLIDSSLTKLFQCMTVAYRQKLTSPKWNRFKGIRIRWKDKIRLNNVIWRCWHMQFIRKENTFVCQFASPLDVDTHNKPEAVVLEGKYWKRKLATVTAEYKKWRMFYKNKIMGWTAKDGPDVLGDIDMFEWQPNSNESAHSVGSMMVDEDYMELMSDTLFTTISQPFAFPNPREIARGAGIADFIQPGLVQLQPNLEDFMDTLEPLQSLHDLLYPKLASVPEESTADDSMFRPVSNNALESTTNMVQQQQSGSSSGGSNYSNMGLQQEPGLQYTAKIYAHSEPGTSFGNNNRQVRHPNQASCHPPAGMPAGAQFYFSATNSMLGHTQDSMTAGQQPSPQHLQSQQQSPQHLQSQQQQQQQQQQHMSMVQEAMAPPPPSMSKCCPPQSSKSNEVFIVPNVNKMKRRSHSGSALLGNSSQRNMSSLGSQLHSPAQHQLSLSSTGLNLMPGEGCSSALLAQLLQPSTSSTSPYHHMKPILPAPSQPSQQQSSITAVPCTTVLVTSPLALTTKPTIPTSSDLTPTTRTQPPLVTSPARDQLGVCGSSAASAAASAQALPPLSAAPGSFSLGSPLSPAPKPFRPKSDQERTHYKEMRRVCHINAEQKRRCNIQNGFQTLQGLIPQLSQSSSSKLSKAALLHKGADYIRQLRVERGQLKDEVSTLRLEIEALNQSINNVQSLLPASGAPVSHQRSTRMREMFDEYVRVRTLQNWKFWIFSVLMQPLLTSYSSSVSTSSMEEMCRSILQWVEQHCALADLRPAVMNALRKLCTVTDILTDPSKLPDQATRAVSGGAGQSSGTPSPPSPHAGASYSLR